MGVVDTFGLCPFWLGSQKLWLSLDFQINVKMTFLHLDFFLTHLQKSCAYTQFHINDIIDENLHLYIFGIVFSIQKSIVSKFLKSDSQTTNSTEHIDFG